MDLASILKAHPAMPMTDKAWRDYTDAVVGALTFRECYPFQVHPKLQPYQMHLPRINAVCMAHAIANDVAEQRKTYLRRCHRPVLKLFEMLGVSCTPTGLVLSARMNGVQAEMVKKADCIEWIRADYPS